MRISDWSSDVCSSDLIKGTVALYFPDSPEGNDFHEFSSLGEGVAGLLQQEQWQGYFRSRICTLDPEEIKRTLGRQRGRPLIRGALIAGNFLEALHRAHVNSHSAYADHRSTSNRDVHRQTSARQLGRAECRERAGQYG